MDALFTGLAECTSAVETRRMLESEARRIASVARAAQCSEARLGIEYDVGMARGGAASFSSAGKILYRATRHW